MTSCWLCRFADEWPDAIEVTTHGWGFAGGYREELPEEEVLRVEIGGRAVEHLTREIDFAADPEWDDLLSVAEWKLLTAAVVLDEGVLYDTDADVAIVYLAGSGDACRVAPPHPCPPRIGPGLPSGLHRWWLGSPGLTG